MPIRKTACFGASAIAMFACGSIVWADTPRQVLGKSMVVAWRETRMQRLEGSQNFYAQADDLELIIYVSTKGRVFSRLSHNLFIGHGSRSIDEVAGAATERSVGFENGSLHITEPFTAGAVRRITVNADPGADACTARAVFGKQPGSEEAKYRSPITGQFIYFKSDTVSEGAATCSLREGNLFEGR